MSVVNMVATLQINKSEALSLLIRTKIVCLKFSYVQIVSGIDLKKAHK
jgi:hypothetical protein